MKEYIVRKSNNHKLFWNSNDGWVSFDKATIYDKYFNIDLPYGGRIITRVDALSHLTNHREWWDVF
jgi:hypothetical protein